MRGHYAYVKGRVTAMRGDVHRAIEFGHLEQAQGNLPAALETINKGSQVIHTKRVFSEAQDAVITAEIKLRLAQGDRLTVSRLTSSLEKRLSSGDPFRFENELVHITLARGYLAQKNLDECLELLSRLEGNAQTGGRTGRLIQILILKAIALHSFGEIWAGVGNFGEKSGLGRAGGIYPDFC